MSLSFYDSFSQCGAAPTSGLTTVPASTSLITNSYYPGTANAVKNTYSLQVGTIDNRGSATPLASGDMVLIIQMQGADINNANSTRYGDGVNGGNASGYLSTNLVAGNYEYNVVSGFSSGTITLGSPLQHSYFATAFNASTSTGIQTYQVIRIQREYDLTIPATGTITAPAWNGSTGGVVALEVADQLTLNGAVNVDGLGFRGGGGKTFGGTTSGNTNGSSAISNTDYRWNSPLTTAANKTGGCKGEGIAGSPAYYFLTGTTTTTQSAVEGYVGGSMGRGAPGNAGGGGTDGKPSTNEYNPGGGGGGNGGAGGKGGSGWDGGNANPGTYNTGGYGGAAFTEVSTTRFIMGGGGGAGTANNSTGPTEYISSGGCGGGIVLIRAKTFSGSGVISANGAAALDVNIATVTDAAGGGGAGGSIIVVTNTSAAPGTHSITASANGGKGGDMTTYFAHGPGGGGGGGYVLTNVIPSASITVTAGAHGLTRSTSASGPLNNTYNSANGTAGVKSVIATNLGLYNQADHAAPCGALPITLTMWKGIYSNNKTYLTWQAENAIQFSHFVVERSTDGVRFSPLGEVAAINTNAFSQQYSYTDEYPANGLNYYRLKMVDLDGQFTYSGIITIRTDGKGLQISATPNPFTDHVAITIQSTTSETANIRVYNNDGKLVWHKTTYVTAGTNVQYYNDLQTLPKGIYIIKVDKGNTTAGFKMVKQ